VLFRERVRLHAVDLSAKPSLTAAELEIDAVEAAELHTMLRVAWDLAGRVASRLLHRRDGNRRLERAGGRPLAAKLHGALMILAEITDELASQGED
jgi:hypothetical protein